METYKTEFLNFVVKEEILQFGEFTLKSGRVSPYFFNAGLFNTGKKLSFLAECYAAAIESSSLDFCTLFGPAYKGIPLVSATAVALATNHGIDKAYCFNRKENKNHGEGGWIVGSELVGDVLVIDDVITAGTAIKEAANLIRESKANFSGVVVAMDRQEKGNGSLSAIQEAEKAYEISIIHIINLQDIISFLEKSDNPHLQINIKAVNAYRDRYGVR